MDELGALILGKAPETSAKQPAGKSASVITDELLDSLRRVESGKDKFAINKETKAMGPYQFLPETVQMLHKQGIEFNPFNEEQSRAAAKAYLEQLVQRNKGDVKKALADYGGFITKDPTAYVNKVTSGAQTQQTQRMSASPTTPPRPRKCIQPG
jgi:membrane-bound lytic murein transglycosylase B